MLRLLRHTLRFPLLGALSLLMAVACTSLALVLPGITMRFIDTIIGKNRPDLILSTALIGAGAILARQILSTLRSYLNNHLEFKLSASNSTTNSSASRSSGSIKTLPGKSCRASPMTSRPWIA